ncbi:MAG: hypothetical protein ACE5FT_01695 [Candidatus Nanoarchaeia archaeon]
MMDNVALIAVAIVALAAVWGVSSPTGALAGMQCAQIISPEGVGVLYCESGKQAPVDTVFPVRGTSNSFEAGNEQVGLDWKERDGLTYYKTSRGYYTGTPDIEGGPGRLFSGEDYVNRRILQRSETFK